jgi:hypothetical protein
MIVITFLVLPVLSRNHDRDGRPNEMDLVAMMPAPRRVRVRSRGRILHEKAASSADQTASPFPRHHDSFPISHTGLPTHESIALVDTGPTRSVKLEGASFKTLSSTAMSVSRSMDTCLAITIGNKKNRREITSSTLAF